MKKDIGSIRRHPLALGSDAINGMRADVNKVIEILLQAILDADSESLIALNDDDEQGMLMKWVGQNPTSQRGWKCRIEQYRSSVTKLVWRLTVMNGNREIELRLLNSDSDPDNDAILTATSCGADGKQRITQHMIEERRRVRRVL